MEDKRRVRTSKGIFRKLCMSIAILLICMNLFTIWTTYTGERDNLNWMPITLLTVESGSMEPEYSVGDLLIAINATYEDINIGDDICYTVGDTFITHRVVSIDGDSITTQGIANSVADAAITVDSYCAKVIFSIPMLGNALYILQSPYFLVAMTLVLLVLCYGSIVLRWILAQARAAKADASRADASKADASKADASKDKKEYNFTHQLLYRSVSFLLAFTLLAVTPYYTAAKYVDEIYDSTILAAGSMYFTSNYLTQSGSQYALRGWDGTTYTVDLEIRNYENDLLVSDTDQNVYYGFEIIPAVSTDTEDTDEEDSDMIATYGVDYTITITLAEGIESQSSYEGISFTEDNPATGEYAITSNQMVYTMPAAESIDDKISQLFTITVNPVEAEGSTEEEPIYVMGEGEIVKFDIQVYTSEAEHFQVDLSASFQLVMTEETDFINYTSAYHPADSNVVTYSLTTTLIDDEEPMKEVMISWDPDIMYINEFESTAFQVIAAQDSSTFNKAEGWIIISLQAYSSIELQFFLVDSTSSEDRNWDEIITAVVIGEETEEIESE